MEDPKAEALVKYLSNLDFVRLEHDYTAPSSPDILAQEPKADYVQIVDEDYEVPEWHKEIVRKSIAEYEKNPGNYVTLEELKKDLNL